jgi:4-amino-4-deoxyprephenate dehydrogenase
MLKNAIILGGSGQAGSLLIRSLLDSAVEVTEVDLRRHSGSDPNRRYIRADVTRCGPELEEAIRNSDCVCICLPERIALDSAPRLVSAMSDGALWVDTLSVKGPIVRCLEPHAGRVEILSINPMFAPALGWPGHAVAVVEAGQAGPKTRVFKELLAQWGAAVQTVTAEEHDRLTAALQVATHAAVLAFGSVLRKLDYDVKAALEVATPPHRMLLALLYRMISQNPEVYWDIQAYHPHAADVRHQLIASLNSLQTLTESGDIDQFKRLFEDLRSLVSERDETLVSLTTRLIAAVNLEP